MYLIKKQQKYVIARIQLANGKQHILFESIKLTVAIYELKHNAHNGALGNQQCSCFRKYFRG